jgi:proteasome assembly chaperone (PAC2) family protein
MGGTAEPTLFVRATVMMGIVVGIARMAGVSIAVCGLMGTVLGYVVSLPAATRKKAKVAERA